MGWRAPTLVFAVVIVAVLAATTTSTLPSHFDVTPLAKADLDRRLERGTAALIGLGCDLSLNEGTAIAIAPNRVLTNRHVAQRFRSLHVVHGATPAIITTRQHVAVSTGNDVAVVRADGLGAEPIALAAEDPRPGEAVWVAGFAHEPGSASLSDGLVVLAARVVDYVAGRAMAQRGRVMRLDVPVRPGMSGGPVLDQAGRLAGLVFAVQSPTDDTLVIPVSVVRTTLRTNLVEPPGC